jgi:hypothetical protein
MNDFPQGVAEFLGFAAERGLKLPLDFVMWLVYAPIPLDCTACVALYSVARSW